MEPLSLRKRQRFYEYLDGLKSYRFILKEQKFVKSVKNQNALSFGFEHVEVFSFFLNEKDVRKFWKFCKWQAISRSVTSLP